ncbi:hypothetical protein BK816_02370 [Boudabousia tangfeifanii]|uniref:N-acetyltransferase domain-containing protein n=2 Tax=Boudabousia tangfeifanii TaxID=1912795 RepID=A0A1D9MMB6_9ACTO|nr:hypothetical protein BK816_02370 [Boudabousia tangfeifanii]
MRGRDHEDMLRLRVANQEWLTPWEATMPPNTGQSLPTVSQFCRQSDQQVGRGLLAPFSIWVDGELAGEVNAYAVSWQSLCSGMLGYWLRAEDAGRGIMPASIALATDYLLGESGLHRLEVNIMPHNDASLRVMEKLGWRCEGRRADYMYIQGKWQDHLSFATTVEELPAGGWTEFLSRP